MKNSTFRDEMQPTAHDAPRPPVRSHVRARLAVLALFAILVFAPGCARDSIPTYVEDETNPTSIQPVDFSSATTDALVEFANDRILGHDPATPAPTRLGSLPADLGQRLVEETVDAGLVGARLRPGALDEHPPRITSTDFEFFIIGNGTSGGSAIVAPGVDAPSRMASATSSGTFELGNPRLKNGVARLLDLLEAAGMDVDALRDAWDHCRFHEASDFPGGLPEGVEGATFLRTEDGYLVSGFSVWFLIWWDGHHHVVLDDDHSLHLRAGDFIDDSRLIDASRVVLRELARVVAVESGCAEEDPRLAIALGNVLDGGYATSQAATEGTVPSTADVLTLHSGIRDALESGAGSCLDAFGVRWAGSIEIEAPEEVPVGTSIEITATLSWPDGTPATDQFVVLHLETLHEVVRTDASGKASHTFPSGEEPRTVDASGAALGASGRQPVRVVGGTSGACCLPDRSCVLVFPADCATADGTYVGDNTGCDPDPCEDYGACCDADGTCTVRTLESCLENGLQYLGAHVPCDPNACPPNGACCLADGSCLIVDGEACAEMQGAFQGMGTTCDSDPCDFGACCFEDGTCRQATEPGCLNLDGIWQGPGTSCELVSCSTPGACCFANGDCKLVQIEQCRGDFLGESTTCDPNPCPQPGACCIGDGECAVTLAAECDGPFEGEGSSCEPNPCPAPPTGACCWGDGTRCAIRTELRCVRELGGDYLGDGTHCAPDPCAQDGIGACCFETGNCQLRIEEECIRDGGVYLGDEVSCEPNLCSGACCYPSGSCQIMTEADCLHQEGQYFGDGSDCDPYPCGNVGACCAEDGSCELLAEAACDDDGGHYQGDDSACEPNPCPLVPAEGACCSSDGSCTLSTEDSCTEADGVYHGDDSVCEPSLCPEVEEVGACCLPNGECELRTLSACVEAIGTFQGADVPCDDAECEPIGGCCLGSNCFLATQSECESSGGTYQGDDTNCASGCDIASCCLPDGRCVDLSSAECAEADGIHGDWPCEADTCERYGACCLPSGACRLYESAEGCGRNGGTFLRGTPCEPDPCPPFGACCLEDGACRVYIEFECDFFHGEFQGNDTGCDPDPCSSGGGSELELRTQGPEDVTVPRRRGSGLRSSTGSGPGDIFVVGALGAEAFDLDTGASLGRVSAFPSPSIGMVYLDAPFPLSGTNVEGWAFIYGSTGTQRRPWDSQLGWLSTQISDSPVLDACAYDDLSDSGGFVYCDYRYGHVSLLEFNDQGHLMSVDGFPGVQNYASGPPISAFARTAPGGMPGGDVLFVTDGAPGQLWYPQRGSGGTPALIGTVGNEPRQIRALGQAGVVTNFGSDTITLLSWPFGGAPTISATVPVGDGPIGTSLATLSNGSILVATTGFYDDTVTLTVVSSSGQLISSRTIGSPAGCDGPGFVELIEGIEIQMAVSCNGSGKVFITGTGE